MRTCLAILLLLTTAGFSTKPGATRPTCERRLMRRLTRVDFEVLMNQIATGWSESNARKAAACFTEDARYSSMPDGPIRSGRAALFEWFGGIKGRPKPMHMIWHHLIFDPGQQIGVGEYTFEYEGRTHGLVIVKLRNGLITNWREYEHASQLSWEEMVRGNEF